MEDFNVIRKREDIPVEDTWALEDIYPSDEAWEQELLTLDEDKAELESYAGRLAESGQTLYAYLNKMEQTNKKASSLGNYAMRRSDEDTRNSVYQAMTGRFMSIAVALDSACSFESPEIMAIAQQTLDDFYQACPELEHFRRSMVRKYQSKLQSFLPMTDTLGERITDPGDLELGQIFYICRNAHFADKRDFDRLCSMRSARNLLAHGNAIPYDELKKLGIL